MNTPLCDLVAAEYGIVFDKPAARKLRELEESARELLQRCDDEGLLLGGGRNYPGEKEGPLVKRLRKAMAAVPNVEGNRRPATTNTTRSDER